MRDAICTTGDPERGFTLIELLTVIGLLAILSMLSLRTFALYRSNAGNASAQSTLHSAIVAAEASQSDPSNLPPAVGWYFQNTQGSLTGAAEEYLSGLRLPSKTCLWAMYDPSCSGAFCMADLVEVAHCMGTKRAMWVRWGDGWSLLINDVPGGAPWCC